LALAGRDVTGQAQTGTGKTAAFLLALMQRLLATPHPEGQGQRPLRALVLAPTRELAIQIHQDALLLGGPSGLVFALAYGGVDYDRQRADIQAGVDCLIGTPGRIIDYFKQQVFDLKSVEVAVLDEADRMFDLGFIRDIRFLLRRMPPPQRRLTMLFSATLSWRVRELAYEHMNNPVMVEVEPERITAELVTQELFHVESQEKVRVLIGLLRRLDPHRTLIFVNTKRAAAHVTAYLIGNGYLSESISGDVPQPKRQRLIQLFADGQLPILVATDVAARGLHIPNVSHVINFDLPQNEEDYVHRIGRTARAGASGDAISLACEEFVFSLAEIERFIGHKIPVGQITDDLLVDLLPPRYDPDAAIKAGPHGASDPRRRRRPPQRAAPR
jgi:ATP-dependent RNA helicase RhlB